MVFVVVTGTGSVLASTFQCTPIHKAWDTTGKVSGSCINVNALFFANAGLDIFQDAVIYVLPMKMLYQIQIPKRQKMALMMVFAVGGFVVITGMIRLNSLKVAQNTPDPSCESLIDLYSSTASDAFTDNNYGAAVWSAIECNIGVVCASLPTFKPLIDRFFPALMGHSRGPSKLTPSDSASASKRTYTQKICQDSVFELERGTGWKDTYAGDLGGEKTHDCSATANSKHIFRANSSDEHLTGVEAKDRNVGIWKSTSVVVSQGRM